MTSVATYTATIYVGLKHTGGVTHWFWEVTTLCQEYVNRVGLCVSVTHTNFVYTNGFEPGAAVGLINYPRFPSTPKEIREKALELAELLRVKLGQQRVSIVFPDETVMLGDGDATAKLPTCPQCGEVLAVPGLPAIPHKCERSL